MTDAETTAGNGEPQGSPAPALSGVYRESIVLDAVPQHRADGSEACMSDDNPTLSEIGESNIREREKRALAEWEEHMRFKVNEYERL